MQRAPIAVFFAMSNEAGYFEDRLKDREQTNGNGFRLISGTLNEQNFLSIHMGAGAKNAREIGGMLCRVHVPRIVISAGFAGGLNPALPKNALFLPNEFLSMVQADPELERLTVFQKIQLEHLPKELREECRIGGRLLTVPEVVTQPEKKKELGIRFSALAADMETWELANICREMNLPFLSVRVVSDDVNAPLPDDVRKLVQQKTAASRLGAAFKMLVQRPGSVKELWGLYETSVESGIRIADFLETFSTLDLLKFPTENFFVPSPTGKQLGN